MKLVEVKKEQVYCDSLMVSRKFGQKHNKVTRTIEKLICDMEDLRGTACTPKYIKEERNYRGRDYTAYLMDKRFFSLLAMRFKGIKALEWQIKFIDAFFEMENKILSTNINKIDKEWLSSRDQSKLSRKAETDVIKEFVEYATNQGSKSAKFYYKHITNATYQALGLMAQNQPKLRDSMDIYEVSQLILSEKLAKEKISEYMKLGRHYKDIYKSVKNDLIEFSGMLRIE
ncbi:MAG: Rha family transcriptional regulator [Alphaproteobacteria bacterium]|nr:Rha family transcriptional regulator [Alphaproteobacteria bacterium]